MNEYEKLLVLLTRSGVNFITVGGMACAFNGFVRATEDIDILVRRSAKNLDRLLRALATFGEGCARELKVEDFADEEGAIRIVEEFPLDVFVRLDGQTYEQLSSFIRHAEVAGESIPFLDKEALIRIKGRSLREIDKIDVAQLKKLKS